MEKKTDKPSKESMAVARKLLLIGLVEKMKEKDKKEFGKLYPESFFLTSTSKRV